MNRCLVLAMTLLCTPALADAPTAPTASAEDKRGFIGVRYTPGLDSHDQTILILETVLPNSPASKAGLRRGDAVTGINGTPASSEEELRALLHTAGPGDLLTFVIRRRGSTGVRAVPVTVAELTDANKAQIEKMSTMPQRSLKDLGVKDLVYIPQGLCWTGVTFAEAFVLSMQPGSINLPLSELEGCRATALPCAPLMLVQQSKVETQVARGGRKYRLKGDWRSLTFADAAQCQERMPGGQHDQQAEQHP